MKFLSLALVLSLTAAGGMAQAQQKRKSLHDEFSGQGYGAAGCGLGSIVFGDKPGIVQVVAATLNGTAGNQTFGITTGTSNCGESGKQMRAAQFIEVNKVALENDLARGTGEAIVALSEVMGCQNPTFSTQLRHNYVVGSSNEQLAHMASNNCQL